MAAPLCPRASSIVALLLALPLTALASAIFEKLTPGLLSSARSTSCPPQTLQTISCDRTSCAVACGLDSRCHAFLHSDPDRCELLSSPWRSPPSQEGQTLMMRRADPKTKTWHLKGSQYAVTTERGSFDQMKAACAARGMHLWYPNSHEEMRFVEQEILCQLPKEYVYIPEWSNEDNPTVGHRIWFGVIDRPNGNCLLADEATKCPVENYR